MKFNVNGPSGGLQVAVVVLIGLGTIGYGAYSYNAQTSALGSAVEVDATVTSTSVEENDKRRGVSYSPKATFTYTYEGEEYTSSNVYPGTLPREFDTEDDARDALDGYGEDEAVTAYAPPESPGSAYLKKEGSNKPFLVMGIGVLFLFAALYSAVRG